jgi:hypothetical protein
MNREEFALNVCIDFESDIVAGRENKMWTWSAMAADAEDGHLLVLPDSNEVVSKRFFESGGY